MEKDIQKVKNSRFFKKSDLFVYVAVAVIAVVLICVFFVFNNRSELTVVQLFVDDELWLSYDFSADNFSDENKNVIVEEIENGYYVSVINNDEKNIFVIDTKDKRVYMTDANCSFSKDCTYIPAIEKEGDTIICVPHKLKLVAKGDVVDNPVSG